MTVHMNGANTARVGPCLDELCETAGSSTSGRVLTLIIIAKNVGRVRDAITSVADAVRAYPCRIIATLPVNDEEPKVGAKLRVGPEAGLSKITTLRYSNGSADNLGTLVIPLPLLDALVAVWWVQDTPENPSRTPIGTMAQRHITTAQNSGVPTDEILRRARDGYAPDDTDLAWTGMTPWRNHLVTMLDEPPYEVVERVVVCDNRIHPTVVSLTTRLTLRLGVPVEIEHTRGATIDGMSMLRSSGELQLDHPIGSDFGDMVRPDHEVQRVNLTMRMMESKMIEELREMTPDTAYKEVPERGLERVLPSGGWALARRTGLVSPLGWASCGLTNR